MLLANYRSDRAYAPWGQATGINPWDGNQDAGGLFVDEVVLLTAHLRTYGVVARHTSRGMFVQFSMNSVIDSSDVSVRNHLEGLNSYAGSLVDLELEFQPDMVEQRRTLLENQTVHSRF